MNTMTKLARGLMGQLKPARLERSAAAVIELPIPDRSNDKPLAEALAERRSRRDFRPEPLSLTLLSNLLWSAFGINRQESGGRTAPSALNAREVDVYAALARGLYRYDAEQHQLVLVAEADVRGVTGYQDFVDEAPLDLIYVANIKRSLVVSEAQRRLYSAVSAGAITQNVYLFCAAAGLATVVRGWFDRKALSLALGLGPGQEILLAQTVGYPGDAPSSVIEAPERNEAVGKRVTSALRAQSFLALCCAALAAGCATAPFGASDANLELAKNQAAYGSSVFELQCADCHGPRGEGRGGVPAILGEGALSRYPRMESTYRSSYSGADGQQPIRQAPAPELGRPEFVTAQSLQTYLFHHMPKIKREPLTDQDYWAVVSFMLVAHGLEVPADGVSQDNATKVAINPR